MNCLEVRNLLPTHVDRETTREQSQAVRSHVFACESCRQELELLERIKREVAIRPIATPSADLEDRLVAAVLGSSTPSRAISPRSAFFLAAAVFVCAFLGYFALKRSPESLSAPKAPVARDFEVAPEDQIGDLMSPAPHVMTTSYGSR